MARILVVDDEEIVRDLVRETLHIGSHDICFASDGSEALLLAPSVDLVLLDLCLNGEPDGLEICQRLRGPRSPKVILLTGDHQESTRSACMGAGAAAFLTKPFSPLRLIEEVESVLDKVS
ncbi:MAG: response regulator [Gemmatimonadales bacterium]|jgi:two-component system, OmpR family, phosphate regulon response regulator PhoB|nr:response regulator [Gemmatimonadales bacterium]